MAIKCLECGSTNIHIIAYNTEHVRPAMLEPANKEVAPIRNGDLPYILSGYYCCDCQRIISVFDDEPFRALEEEAEPMASSKQKKFIKKLLDEWKQNPEYRSEYSDLRYEDLTAEFATHIINDLLKKQKQHPCPKNLIAKATEKQIALIKKKMEESEELAYKYRNINFDKLNVVTAKRIISEMLS